MSGPPDAPPVDLRSDTVTRPTPAMREAIARAEVGDDVLGKDPTVGRLEERVAELLGKEAALFFPSGTMANQAAILLHTRPGTEAVCEAEAHVFHYEMADVAMLSGVQLRIVPSERGRVEAAAYAAAVRPDSPHLPTTSLLCVENTHNMHGGVVVPLASLRAIRELAAGRGLPVHLDGARLWNAWAATGTALDEWADCADTVMVSLSKGLGCPVGSVLAGPAALIERAWTVRKRLGGGMRQVGILAAAGLHALDHHLDRLEEDHRRARRLAAACREVPGLEADEPETNIAMIRVGARAGPGAEAPEEGEGEGPPLDPAALSRALAERGVWILPAGPDRLRAVTHLDVDDAGIERAAAALAEAVGEVGRSG